jgi:hypothetical protein
MWDMAHIFGHEAEHIFPANYDVLIKWSFGWYVFAHPFCPTFPPLLLWLTNRREVGWLSTCNGHQSRIQEAPS